MDGFISHTVTCVSFACSSPSLVSDNVSAGPSSGNFVEKKNHVNKYGGDKPQEENFNLINKICSYLGCNIYVKSRARAGCSK